MRIMVTLHHIIMSSQGLHARPVSAICRCVLDGSSRVDIACNGRLASGDNLVGLMALDARCGDALEVSIEGPDETRVAAALRGIFDTDL